MNIVLILTTILLFVFQTLAMKLQRAEHLSQKLLINSVTSLAGALVLGIGAFACPTLFAVSAPTFRYGLGFGALFALTILFYNLAISTGPLSYTTFYFSASMLVPTLAGVLFFKETLSPSLFVAVVLFLAAFYLLNVGSGKQEKAQAGWSAFCGLAFFCNGASAVVQKAQQVTTGGTEAFGLMLVGFSWAAVFYSIAYLVTRRRLPPDAADGPMLVRNNRLALLLLTVGSVGGNVLLTLQTGQVPASYLFPLVQGSIVVGVVLCSVLLFKEKLPLRGKLGLALGICAIVTINL